MILYRYINRQLFMTTVVVTFVLVMVLVSGRFIRYLASAAVGDIDAAALFWVMGFRLPEFLQMILPLSLFIAVLLVLGRMYSENEMVVLRACGISQERLIRAMALPVGVTTLVIAFFSLYVTPMADSEVTRIFEEQRGRSVLELLTPGRFHVRGAGDSYQATYAEGLDRDNGVLERVFISDFRPATGSEQSEMLTVWAETGRLIDYEGITYLELLEGHQYSGRPGDGDFRKVLFERALVRVGNERSMPRPPAVRALGTDTLLTRLDDPEASAELQWRIALVLLVPVMTIAAIPLARVNPRQGRFGKLIPAVLLYLFYVGLIMVMRGWIEDTPTEERPFWYHTAWVHLLAIALVASLYLWPVLRARAKGVASG